MHFYGEFLPDVLLRFNRSSRFATAASPSSGIRKFGPYDSDIFSRRQIKCGLVYPSELNSIADTFIDGLTKGVGSLFPGFSSLFKTNLSFAANDLKSVSDVRRGFVRACNDLAKDNCDLVFVILLQREGKIYRDVKSTLLSNGIPCQLITAAKLRDPSQLPWILGNIALSAYAKVGGTPWVVADSLGGRELVMGVSRAQDENGKLVVGFVTLFNQDGDFLFLHSKTPVLEWERYVGGLEEMIIDAYQDYEEVEGAPQSLVIHFHKRPGERELEAVESALNHLGQSIPYALIHLNEFSAFRLFDTSDISYVPKAGLQIDLSLHRSLLLLDGKVDGKRKGMGVPNVWDISMDKRSTVAVEEFPRLVRQVQRFSKVNWRGFNAKSVPVTMNYSKLICAQVTEIGLDSWNSIVSNGKLMDKAWFL